MAPQGERTGPLHGLYGCLKAGKRFLKPFVREGGHLLLGALITAGLLWRVMAYPEAQPSEDSWRLARGIEHYAIVDQSPHFPGYPTLVMMGRALRDSAALSAPAALHWLNALALLVLIVVLPRLLGPIQRLVIRFGRDVCVHKPAYQDSLMIGCVALNPLVLGAAHSGLSDLPGMSLALLSVYFALTGRMRAAAFTWGVGAGVRPGLAVLWVTMLIVWAVGYRGGRRGSMLFWAMLPIVSALAWMWQHDGAALISEALRFVAGHFTRWGSPFAQDTSLSWPESLARYGLAGGLIGLACGGPVLGWQRRDMLWWMWLSMFVWTLLGQNPAHLRHLLPVALLALLWSAVHEPRFLIAIYTPLAIIGLLMWMRAPVLSPLDAAERELSLLAGPNVLLTRHAPERLSQRLYHLAVVDPGQAGDAGYWQSQGGLWRLTTTAPGPDITKKRAFMARFPTEQTLYLWYQPPR